ncbi:MAG: sugar transporter [Paludibacteraceae bacterium]|nr:sugar transporter [Paludibacteraceae bacterium]MBQ9672574.1 sugar transporter [Prevotella sp.]
MSGRVGKSVMNVKVGMFFYLLSLLLAFFSRNIFLNCLGAEFMGLTGVLQNILSYLNVAELGIGTSITFFLYKPLQQDDHMKTSEIMSVLAYLYRCIGWLIGGVGVLISLAFPLFFGGLSVSLPLIYFAFYSFLATSMAGYLINYRQLLVSANQKQYVVNGYFQTIAILQSLTQIVLAWFYQNLYLWVAVGLFYTIVGCIVFNRRISKEYPWLKIDLRQGRKSLKDYPEILRKTRQVFIQRIKDLLLYRSDDLLVATFVSVVQSAFYFNYTMLVNKLNFMVNILSDGMNAGIGNLIAEGNRQNTMKVFWELTAIRFLITGLIVFGFLMFMQPFVRCWLGDKWLLSDLVVYLLLANVFITLSRGVVEMYISACGLFHDVWAAWTELFLNLGITLALAPFLGIPGILLGKILSVFFIALFWKPHFLFSEGLHVRVADYWRGMLPYYLIFAVFLAVAVSLKVLVIDPYVDSWGKLTVCGVCIVPVLMLVYFLVLFAATRGMKYFIARKPAIYQKLRFLTKQE